MFGFGKPRWAIDIRHRKLEEYYTLQSDSIGRLIGYISIPLERGQRPSMDWVVEFRHKSNNGFRILPIWPDDNDPEGQIISRAMAIDPKLIRAKSPPKFFKLDSRGKKVERLSLEAQVNGVSTVGMSLEDHIRSAQEGHEATMSIHSLVNRAFEDHYDPNRDSVLLKVDY